MYCKKCGGKLESYASNCAFCGTPVEKYDTNVNYVKKETSEEVKHMTGLKWFGLWLLPSIPVIGVLIYLILMFKWSSKNNTDLTLRSYAKANLFLLLLAVLFAVMVVVFVMMNPGIIENILAGLETAK